MIAVSDGRVAPADFFTHQPDADHDFSRVDRAWRQSNKDLPGRSLVDGFNFLVEVSGVNYPNLIRSGRVSRRTPNFGLIKKVVTIVKNYSLLADVSITKL